MKMAEPGSLPEIGSLATNLKSQPLIAKMLFFEGVVAQDMLGIILLNDVLYDRTRLPES